MAKTAKKRVYFTFERPDAEEVHLVGSFNDWEDGRLLKRDKKGVWKTWMSLAPGRYEYRYLVDGHWENDPEAEHCPNPHGGHNCLQIVEG